MVISIYSRNVPQAYAQVMQALRDETIEETSRNGMVMTIPTPVFLTIQRPDQRVLTDPIRDANPFFHVMEFVWMMSGSQDSQWISQFNKKFISYADLGTTTIHGAYGHRWLQHFAIDQINAVIKMLIKDRLTRRAVIGMWDPKVDLYPHNDLPCNTSIMFRYVNGKLNMTVVNRSNDAVWGMLGANSVHMTLLHELVASASGLPLGNYQVFTNNLHFYPDMPNGAAIWTNVKVYDQYRPYTNTYPLLSASETLEELQEDCHHFVHGEEHYSMNTQWMQYVAFPMFNAWHTRTPEVVEKIEADDWRTACMEWISRRIK